MQKLGLRSATELILLALQEGWVEHGVMARFQSAGKAHDGRSREFQDTVPYMHEQRYG